MWFSTRSVTFIKFLLYIYIYVYLNGVSRSVSSNFGLSRFLWSGFGHYDLPYYLHSPYPTSGATNAFMRMASSKVSRAKQLRQENDISLSIFIGRWPRMTSRVSKQDQERQRTRGTRSTVRPTAVQRRCAHFDGCPFIDDCRSLILLYRSAPL